MSTSTEDRHKKLLAMRDEDIDYSDIPELDDDFWANSKVVMPKKKEQISTSTLEGAVETTARFTIEVEMYSCNADPCYYGLGIFYQ